VGSFLLGMIEDCLETVDEPFACCDGLAQSRCFLLTGPKAQALHAVHIDLSDQFTLVFREGFTFGPQWWKPVARLDVIQTMKGTAMLLFCPRVCVHQKDLDGSAASNRSRKSNENGIRGWVTQSSLSTLLPGKAGIPKHSRPYSTVTDLAKFPA
jgi:hypothetical protein